MQFVSVRPKNKEVAKTKTDLWSPPSHVGAHNNYGISLCLCISSNFFIISYTCPSHDFLLVKTALQNSDGISLNAGGLQRCEVSTDIPVYAWHCRGDWIPLVLDILLLFLIDDDDQTDQLTSTERTQWRNTHWTRLDKCQGPPESRGPDRNFCIF